MSEKVVQVAKEEEVAEKPAHYPCVCPCACGLESTIPSSLSVVLSYHARCRKCAHVKHMKDNPIVSQDADSSLEERGFITVKHKQTNAELTAERNALKEVQREIWQEQWDRWEASLPEKFRDAETKNPQVLERLHRLRDGKMEIASIVSLGDPGVGKTWLAVAYANAAILQGYLKPSEVIFGSEADLLSSAANAPYAEVEKAFQKLTSGRYKMIIIDDVGRAPWLREDMRPKVWSLVLDRLYSDNRIVVITSNLDQDHLREHMGEGAMDRLRSMVGYNSIILKDPQRRKVTEEILKGGPRVKAPSKGQNGLPTAEPTEEVEAEVSPTV